MKKNTKKQTIEPAQSADFTMPEELVKNSKSAAQLELEEENAKTLRQQLKAIAEKIDTKKKERHREAAKRSRLKRLAKQAEAKGIEPSEILSSQEPIPALNGVAASDVVFFTLAEATVAPNSTLKVLHKGDTFYVVKEFTNIFGVMTDLLKEFKTKTGALKDFSERLLMHISP